MNTQSVEEEGNSDVPDLQGVLTRYVDSSRGYSHAAELMERPDLAGAFAEIAARRGEVAAEIATLIQREGEDPEEEASVEGTLHRWWTRLLDTLSDEELETVLGECIRGEKVLLATLEKALDSQGITARHAGILRRGRDEIAGAIEHFSSALGE